MKLTLDVTWGCSQVRDWWTGEFISRMAPSHSCRSPQHCHSVPTMPFSRVSHPRGQGGSSSILWLILETHTVTCAVFSWSPWSSLSQCRRHSGCEPQSDGPLGPSSRVATTVSTVARIHRRGQQLREVGTWGLEAEQGACRLKAVLSDSLSTYNKRWFIVYFDAYIRIFRNTFKVRKFLGAPSWKEILGA